MSEYSTSTTCLEFTSTLQNRDLFKKLIYFENLLLFILSVINNFVFQMCIVKSNFYYEANLINGTFEF